MPFSNTEELCNCQYINIEGADYLRILCRGHSKRLKLTYRLLKDRTIEKLDEEGRVVGIQPPPGFFVVGGRDEREKGIVEKIIKFQEMGEDVKFRP